MYTRSSIRIFPKSLQGPIEGIEHKYYRPTDDKRRHGPFTETLDEAPNTRILGLGGGLLRCIIGRLLIVHCFLGPVDLNGRRLDGTHVRRIAAGRGARLAEGLPRHNGHGRSSAIDAPGMSVR